MCVCVALFDMESGMKSGISSKRRRTESDKLEEKVLLELNTVSIVVNEPHLQISSLF